MKHVLTTISSLILPLKAILTSEEYGPKIFQRIGPTEKDLCLNGSFDYVDIANSFATYFEWVYTDSAANSAAKSEFEKKYDSV